MVSPLGAIMEKMVEIWEDLTPVDEPNREFREVDAFGDDDTGLSHHRKFKFEDLDEGLQQAERGAAHTVIQWKLEVTFRLSMVGKNPRERNTRLASELAQVSRAADALASNAWPAGTVEVITRGSRFRNKRKEHVDVVLMIDVSTQEVG